MICRKCGHTDGMHDERGCVALNCSCDRYVPVPTNVAPFDQPGRGPLIAVGNGSWTRLPEKFGARTKLSGVVRPPRRSPQYFAGHHLQ